jgi:hypothetical protein
MEDKGFWGSLTDFSFDSIGTPRLVRVLYVIAIVGIVLQAIFWIIGAFANDAALGILTLLIFAPVVSFVLLLWVRLTLEVALAVIRILHNTGVASGQGGVASLAPATAQVGFGGPPAPPGLGATEPGGGPAAAPPGQPAAGGPGQPPGWYPDPQGKARVRYWDGTSWTDHTAQ